MKKEVGFSEHIFYILISLFYITYIGALYYDYSSLLGYEMIDFSIIYKTWMLFIFYIIVSYLYRKYEVIIASHIFILILLFDIISSIKGFLHNEAVFYYLYFYGFLGFIHLFILCYCIFERIRLRTIYYD